MELNIRGSFPAMIHIPYLPEQAKEGVPSMEFEIMIKAFEIIVDSV